MSPAELAKAANLDQGLISRIKRGITEATPNTMKAIARALRIPVENIYRMTGLLPAESTHDAWLRRMQHKLANAETEEERRMLENMIDLILPDTGGGAQEAKKRNGRATQHL